MTIYYRATAIGDPYALGSNKLPASLRTEFNGAGVVYTLGAVTGKGFAYTTDPKEELGAFSLDTPAAMADRIDYLIQTPPIYNRVSKLADVSKALRAYAPPVVAAPTPATSLPTGPIPPMVPLAAFNNGKPANGATWFGATIGKDHSGGDWPTPGDFTAMVAMGLKCIRVPFIPSFCVDGNGVLNPWVINTLSNQSKQAIKAGVSVVLDAHTYLPFSDPSTAANWALFAPAMEKAIGGPNPMFGIELANEPGKGSKDVSTWATDLRKTIAIIRAAGYQGYIFAGAGDWNNITFLPTALATIGSEPLDPYGRTIITGHDYWEKDANPGKTRNDQGVAVDGTIDIAKRYGPALDAGRKYGYKIAFTEVGGGLNQTGPFPPYNGIGKDGLALQNEFYAFAKANEDVLVGTWFWAGGDNDVNYRHKVKAGNYNTNSLQTFW